MKPSIKGATKMPRFMLEGSTTLHNLLFCSHTLCMNYITNAFLLVSSSIRSEQLLCFVQGQGQKSEKKYTIKDFLEFHNYSPLLTMVWLTQGASFVRTLTLNDLPAWILLNSLETVLTMVVVNIYWLCHSADAKNLKIKSI